MKLNIGCGKQYLPGYINVDMYEPEIADVIASGDNLDFIEDNSVDEIISYHFIEHLGLIDTYKTLSHWAIKLKPGGRLVLETPDLESSLKSTLRKQTTCDVDWLFGVADPGQTHQRVYFKTELKNILKSIGYNNIRISKPMGYWKRNTLRLESKMGVSDFRARVLEYWCKLDLAQGTFRDLPIDEIELPLTEKRLAMICVLSPILANILLNVYEQLFDTKKNKSLDDWKTAIKFLEEHKFTHYLYSQLYLNNGSSKKLLSVFKEVQKAGNDLIIRILRKKQVTLPNTINFNTNNQLNEVFQFYPDIIDYFSLHNLNTISINECALGIKMFAQNKYERAVDHFIKSTKFNSENVISWWNLARLNWINKNKPEADKAFSIAFKISKNKNILTEQARKIPIKQPLELSYGAEV